MRELSKDELKEIKSMLEPFNNQEKIVDKSFLVDLIDYLKDTFELEDYIKVVRTSDIKDNRNFVSSYEFESKTINATYNKLLSYIRRNMKINKEFITISNELINYYMTKVMIHEVHHARQFKEVIEGKNSFIKYLLPLDIEYFLTLEGYVPNVVIEKNKLYDINYQRTLYNHLYNFAEVSVHGYLYNKNPVEVDAEVRALRNTIKLMNEKENEEIRDYFLFLLYYKYLEEYSFGKLRLIPGAETFMNVRNRIVPEERVKYVKDVLEKHSSNMSLNKRLSYALPVEKDEYNSIVDKFNKVLTRLTKGRK